MITFFSCPKSFEGEAVLHQYNAIMSWKNLSYPVEILIFGNDRGVSEFCEEHNIINIPDISRSKRNTPLLNDIFNKAQEFARHNILVYINADIIVTDKFIEAILSVTKREFLIIGQRTDIDLNWKLDFKKDWSNILMKIAEKNGTLLEKTGMDYFVFKKGLYKDLPPFLIGRTLWDPYLVYYAKEKGCDLIDITFDSPVYHSRHDYSHINQTKDELWNGEEAEINRKLCGAKIANIVNCTYKLKNGKILLSLD